MKILIYGLNYFPEPVGIVKYTDEMSRWFVERSCCACHASSSIFSSWRISPGYCNAFVLDEFRRTCSRCLVGPGSTHWSHPPVAPCEFALSSLGRCHATTWRPDLLVTIAPAFFCAPGALLLGRLCGPRSWLHIQDFELDAAFELGLLKGRLLRSLAEAWERRTLRGFDRVSSISTAMVRKLGTKGVKASDRVLLPNWVDLDVISPQLGAPRLENSYRRELAISADQLVLMYSGSMNKKQGLDLLVKVIHQLADVPQVVWLLAGEGPTKAELVGATQGLPNVRHLSLQPMERLNDWLNAADIHLLPQKAEAADLVLPSKLLGILASGRPVVASSPMGSELAGLADQAGACVPPGDVNAFAAALRQLISSPQRRAAAGRRARLLAEDRFGMEAVLSRLEQQLMDLVSHSSTHESVR